MGKEKKQYLDRIQQPMGQCRSHYAEAGVPLPQFSSDIQTEDAHTSRGYENICYLHS